MDIRASQSHTITIPDVSIPMTHFPCGVDNKSKRTRDAVSASSSVTGLVFKDYSYVISCGAGDGLIKVWDIRKTYYSSQHVPTPIYTLPYAGTTLRNGFKETGISVLTSPIKKTKMQLSFKRKLSTSTEKHDDDDNTTKRIKFHNVLSNLPNFVVDGISPHLNLSPEKKPERDWLTKLRIKRCSVTQMHVLSRSSPTKIIKIDGSPSSKRKQQKTEISSPSSQRPLLQYFKLTSSTSPSCRAKSPNCITSSQKSQTSQ
ncbi:hypothetical protein FQA39_LY17536 [Lamprigera yunnana]|nr:hypothetical protein FQA39_LY17536 [Lamprigera yunnana]